MSTPAQKLISDANAVLSGKHPDFLLDWRDAAQMYLSAGEFGLGEGYAKLAEMYCNFDDEENYFKTDPNKSLSLYKKAVSLGYYECLPQMGGLYLYFEEENNFLKVWRVVFDNPEKSNLTPHLVSQYISICWSRGLEKEIDPRVKRFEDEIVEMHNRLLEKIISKTENVVDIYERGLELVNSGEMPPYELKEVKEVMDVWRDRLKEQLQITNQAMQTFGS